MAENNISKLTSLKLSIDWDGDLSSLNEHLKKVNKIIKDATRKNAALSKQLTDSEFNYVISQKRKLTSAILREEKRKNESILREEKKNIAEIERAAKASAKAKAAEEKRASREASNTYVSKWKSAFGTLTRYMSAGVLINSIWTTGKRAVTAFLEIEQAMSKVRAITSATNSELKKLESTILSTAASIGISTTEASNFVIEMAKMGKTPEQINKLAMEAGTLSSVLGEDLSASGILIVTTLNQYSLSISEAARVTGTFYDVIKNSPMAVDDLKTSMQYVGTAASAAGLSIEETGVMIEFLSNNGLKASKIGTGLRNVILKLSKSGLEFKSAAKAMAEEGLTLAEAMKEFGIRGSTAAELILNNWDILSEKMQNAYPRASEAFASRMVATANSLNFFSRAWGQMLAILKGDKDALDMSKQASEFRDLSSMLSETDKSFLDITKSYDKLKDKFKGKELSDAIAKDIGGDIETRLFKGLQTGEYVFPEARALEDYVKMLSEQEELFGKIRGVEDKYGKIRDEIVNGVGRDADKAEKAVKEIKEMVGSMTADFISAGVDADEAKTRALNMSIDMQTAVKTSIEDVRTSAQLLKDLAENNKKIVAIELKYAKDNTKDTVFARKELEKLKEESASINQMLCAYWNINCEEEDLDEVDWRSIRRLLRNRLDKVELEFKAISEDIKFGLDKMLEGISVDKAKSDLKLGATLSPEEYFRDNMDIFGIPNIDKSKYEQYIDKQIKEYKGSIEKTAIKSLIAVQTTYDRQKEANENMIKRYRSIISEANDGTLIFRSDEEKKDFIEDSEKAIEDLKIILDRNERKRDKDVEDVNAKLEISVEKANAKAKQQKLDLIPEVEENSEKKLKAMLNVASDAIGFIGDITSEYMRSENERVQAMYQDQLDAVRSRYEEEQDILDSANNKKLISQEAYELAKRELDKKRIDNENEVNEAMFNAQKEGDLNLARANGIAQAAQAWISTFVATLKTGNILGAGILASAAALMVAAKSKVEIEGIKKRQFYPQRYEQGGIVEGAPHSRGGVPFNVRGSSVPREMEGGEYIVRKSRVTPQTLPILDSLNNSKTYSPTHFESGGLVPSSGLSIDDLAELLVKTPIRAFITTRDLDAEAARKNKTTKRTVLWR